MPYQRQRLLSSLRGFTLFEIIVTIAVLALGVIPLVHVFSQGLVADQSLESQSIALNLAQEQMEAVKAATSWANIDTYAAAKSNIGGAFSGYSREVLVSGNPKQVTVNVYWTFKGAERVVTLATLFTNLTP